MKFSMNTNEFKENLIKLRKDLNESLEKGNLKEDFEDKLLAIEENENIILNELLSYYRLYAPNLYETKINSYPIKVEGTFKSESYLKSYLKIKKDIFFFCDSNQKSFFGRILDEDKSKLELSSPIKNFNKLIIFCYQINEDKFLVFTVSGEIFIFSCKNSEDFFENINSLKINKVETKFKGFENIINLSDKKFLCQLGRNHLLILGFNDDYSKVKVLNQIKLSIIKKEISSLIKISNSKFAIATSDGNFLEANFFDKEIKIEINKSIFEGRIEKLALLENENLDKNICAILGESGKFALYDLEKKEVIKLEKEKIKGNLFNISSKNGSDLILTEDGFAYLLEENMGEWKLNSKVFLSELFLINLIPIESSNFLSVDFNGNFSILNIDRLDSLDKLKSISLYD